MGGPFLLGEAFLLGLASGPACVASCGPVVVPSLLAEGAGWRLNARYLTSFLGTRLLGYLLFAVVVWELGALLSARPAARTLIYGGIHVLLGVALLWYARSIGRGCAHACAGSGLVSIGRVGKRSVPGAAVLGLLTGVSLCPPFVAAGMRAAQLGSIAAALLFFAVFFVATTLWFVPFVGLGCVQRNASVIFVARTAMVLVALYYLFAGIAMLAGRRIYG
ncbi:MAG TPA: sulfite exporter TauE/SafE family protein [Candidatus Acidoferrum sp.]|nr:sulfite exporter TauE/SafE family protein [Candidatus Acidoferrum sp.]